MTKSVTFILLIISTSLLEKGSGIRCFQCKSLYKGKCLEPERYGMQAVYCTAALRAAAVSQINDAILGEGWSSPVPGEEYPKKEKEKEKEKEKGKEKKKPEAKPAKVKYEATVIRACQSDDDNPTQFCEKMHNKAADNIDIKYCSICEDDECNASNRISSLTILLLSPLIISLIYLFIN